MAAQQLLLLPLLLAALLPNAAASPHVGAGMPWLSNGTASFSAGSNRRLMASGNEFYPAGGKGAWFSGVNSGEVVAWQVFKKGYNSVVLNPFNGQTQQLLGAEGIHSGSNAFCGAQTTSPNQDIFMVGGHTNAERYFRHYNHNTRTVKKYLMSSNRWYPGVGTLPDGKIITIGGVTKSGVGGWGATGKAQYNNPTYEIIEPYGPTFGGDQQDMREQLTTAFPMHEYAAPVVTPDGGLAVVSGKTLYKYKKTNNPFRFAKEFRYQDCPHPSRAYPQTGVNILLPLHYQDNYQRLVLMQAGGSAQEHANSQTPASKQAQFIELSAGKNAQWYGVNMPLGRVMSDAVHLCDGTILLVNGATQGVAGWGSTATKFRGRDRYNYNCQTKCGNTGDNFQYEPTIFDPVTGKFSAKGSLSMAARGRGYHSIALLMPDCRVMVGGSDVTNDHTAEFFYPPHLAAGPRPNIVWAPDAATWGQQLPVQFTTVDPVDRVILIRTGSATHSQGFDARALWLPFSVIGAGGLSVSMPPTRANAPPGMYYLILLSNKGVPSVSKIISLK
ncbi:galactose oxidase [Chlorella sorokiniana]|uniref:Galactose oxidase n=1 Tax=Chlorella sorokiniana TaxID=3076 RepID=A0A2P6TQ38_CHLSO|nr:galactose oxidase [Chlorella sorokiniana]|eukprot:PRW56142.1 galactose oxidase [Chlorella sorokiniana]